MSDLVFRYSFDTSAIINGRRDLLPPDVFPGVWAEVERLISAGVVRSTDIVRDELRQRDDDQRAWAEAQSDLFIELDSDIQAAATEVLRSHPRLTGVGGTRHAADPFVIALARARGGTVVTEEKERGAGRTPHIPDVCRDLDIPFTNLVGFLRTEGIRFQAGANDAD